MILQRCVRVPLGNIRRIALDYGKCVFSFSGQFPADKPWAGLDQDGMDQSAGFKLIESHDQYARSKTWERAEDLVKPVNIGEPDTIENVEGPLLSQGGEIHSNRTHLCPRRDFQVLLDSFSHQACHVSILLEPFPFIY